MKKIAILGAVLALSTSALADENSFYAKVGAFGNIGHKLYADGVQVTPNFKTTSDNNVYGDFAFGGTIGAGYYVMSNLRVGLDVSYFGGPKYTYKVSETKETTPVAVTKESLAKKVEEAKTASAEAGKALNKDAKSKKDEALKTAFTKAKEDVTKAEKELAEFKPDDKAKKADATKTTTGKEDILVKVSGPVGFLNAYVDVFEAGPAKFYVGAGVGMSYVEVEVTDKNVKEVKSNESDSEDKTTTPISKWDAKARFAWNIGAGVAFDVADGVALEAGYSFVDLGTPGKDDEKKDSDDKKPKANKKSLEWKGESIKSHNINVGVRFSL